MPLTGAAIVGVAEYKPQRASVPVMRTGLEQAADLTLRALADCGLNGLSVAGIYETANFVPATLTEYLGMTVSYGEALDLGGATSVSMIGRATGRQLASCNVVFVSGNGGIMSEQSALVLEGA